MEVYLISIILFGCTFTGISSHRITSMIKFFSSACTKQWLMYLYALFYGSMKVRLIEGVPTENWPGDHIVTDHFVPGRSRKHRAVAHDRTCEIQRLLALSWDSPCSAPNDKEKNTHIQYIYIYIYIDLMCASYYIYNKCIYIYTYYYYSHYYYYLLLLVLLWLLFYYHYIIIKILFSLLLLLLSLL